MLVTTHRLTTAEQEAFDRDGYIVRESVFTREECDQIVALCEDLVARLAGARNGRRFTVGSYTFEPDAPAGTMIKWEGDTDIVHGIEPFAHLAPELAAWAYDARFIEPMIDIVGDDAPVLFTEKLNLKRPQVGGANPLHQDYPYWKDGADDATRIATTMLFLDDASLENGTLQVVPGSHTQGVWRLRQDSDQFGNLELDPTLDDEVQDRVVAVCVPAGSIVMFGSFLVHKSAINTSDRERRSLLYSYQPDGFNHTLHGFRSLGWTGDPPVPPADRPRAS